MKSMRMYFKVYFSSEFTIQVKHLQASLHCALLFLASPLFCCCRQLGANNQAKVVFSLLSSETARRSERVQLCTFLVLLVMHRRNFQWLPHSLFFQIEKSCSCSILSLFMILWKCSAWRWKKNTKFSRFLRWHHRWVLRQTSPWHHRVSLMTSLCAETHIDHFLNFKFSQSLNRRACLERSKLRCRKAGIYETRSQSCIASCPFVASKLSCLWSLGVVVVIFHI